MALLTILLLIFLPTALIIYELYRRKLCSTLPPGPPSLPIVGNILQFLNESRPKHEIVAEMSSKYGDLFTVWFFAKPTVFLSSFEAVRQAYIDKQHDFASRPDTLVAVGLFDDYHNDLSFGRYTPKWQAKRKLFHHSVRTLVGTRQFEQEISDVVGQVISNMVKEGPDAAIDIQYHIHMAYYNAALILAFGKRFEFDDPEFLRFVEMHNHANKGISVCRFYDIFPFLQYFPIFKISPALRNMKKAVGHFQSYLLRWFVDARRHSAAEEAENMVQALANGINAAETKAEQEIYKDEEIMHMLMNLFTASTIPTSSATLWLLLEMILRPEIQQKCFEDLQNVTAGRLASLEDRKNLPYIEACIMEALRHHSPISLNLPHAPGADASLRDFTIPAGTETVINIWALHHDPKLWKDPNNYNPHNFLDENGQVTRPPYFFPFGAGRRVCPGDAFAKNLMFLTFTHLLNEVRLEKVPGCQYTTEWSDFSSEFINVPSTYSVKVVRRE